MRPFLTPLLTSMILSGFICDAAWIWKDDDHLVQNQPAISFLDVLGGAKSIQVKIVHKLFLFGITTHIERHSPQRKIVNA